jgi:sirohydrochlorin cobaltochelatase
MASNLGLPPDSPSDPACREPAESASAAPPFDGLLLVGHGTRESAGVAEFGEFARKVAARLAPVPVAPCFLELAEPLIADGVDSLAAQGVRRMVVAPVLLFAAVHAKLDIPEAVTAALAGRPPMSWRQASHLGLDPRVLELSARRFAAAVDAAEAEHEKVSPDETLLVVVGRGSRDPEALAEFAEYAARHAAAVGCRNYQTAFLAMAVPTLSAALDRAAASRYRRIVVQPHLLFGGVLVEQVRDEVAGRQRSTPEKQWQATGHLGPDELLVAAVVEAANL